MILFITLALLAVLTALELRFAVDRRPGARLLNVWAFVLYLASTVAFQPAIAAATVAGTNRLGGGLVDLAGWPFMAGLAVYLVVMDFGEFVFHRAQHAIPALWRMHALHHSDPNMNATTAARHFWGDPLLKAATIWPAAGLLLAPTGEILAAYAAISLYHFVTHANLPVGFGRWSWVLNAPAYHRVHHSSELEDRDANFAALLPIFDVLAGSYRRPIRTPPTGLAQTPRTLGDVLLWPLRYREEPTPAPIPALP